MNTIKYEPDLCTGCGNCYNACWLDVIRWDAEAERPIFAYPEDCVECNFCEISCSEQIVKVNPDFTKQWPDVYYAKTLHQPQPPKVAEAAE
ncbi:ferredoxin family protein [uncultured Cohaesibacter sp.]|uniref:4Fe-4S dicluster domain-containing protein n=1 Tax=uncultured Cohaesibacter sp. TaxID=1002546 RepID=UPI0029C6281B|nr:ferredoxin family protein [uncultured Cohaesibacter sp.]